MTAVSGIGAIIAENGEADATPYLREKKTRKYLGLQDSLAVVAVGRALDDAGLRDKLPAERTGLYAAVGYIPFLERDIAPVLAASLDENGDFSLLKFGAEGYTRAHPLLAFRCLPNMPAFHVAANFGIEGPYTVLYPGAGELYLALDEASRALADRRVDIAIVLGVAHQRNFLVEHHFAQLDPPVEAARLRDAAAAIVLERERGRISLQSLTLEYSAHYSGAREEFADGEPIAAELGPAAPLLALHAARERGAAELHHKLRARAGISAESRWAL